MKVSLTELQAYVMLKEMKRKSNNILLRQTSCAYLLTIHQLN